MSGWDGRGASSLAAELHGSLSYPGQPAHGTRRQGAKRWFHAGPEQECDIAGSSWSRKPYTYSTMAPAAGHQQGKRQQTGTWLHCWDDTRRISGKYTSNLTVDYLLEIKSVLLVFPNSRASSRSPKSPALQLLQKSSKSSCAIRPRMRGRRGRFGTLLQLLECRVFGRTAVFCIPSSGSLSPLFCLPARSPFASPPAMRPPRALLLALVWPWTVFQRA